MEENLKSARQLHWLIVLVLFANLLFAIPLFGLQKYDEPISHLSKLVDFDFSNFRAFQLKKIRKFHSESEPIVELMKLFNNRDVSYTKDFELRTIRTIPWETQFQWSGDTPSDSITLAQMNRMIRSSWSENARTFRMNGKSLVEILVAVLNQHAHVCASELNFWGNTSHYITEGYEKEIDAYFIYSTGADCEQRGAQNGIIVDGEKVDVPQTSFANWVRTQPDLLELFDEETSTVIFPGLSAVWPEVLNMDAENALATLEARRSQARQSISAFGFGIPYSVALYVGPIAALVLMLLLDRHVRRIRDLSTHKRQFGGYDFPWVATFQDRVSSLMTGGSLVVLPAASFGFLLIALRDRVDIAWVTSLLLSVLSVAVGAHAYWQIRRL